MHELPRKASSSGRHVRLFFGCIPGNAVKLLRPKAKPATEFSFLPVSTPLSILHSSLVFVPSQSASHTLRSQPPSARGSKGTELPLLLSFVFLYLGCALGTHQSEGSPVIKAPGMAFGPMIFSNLLRRRLATRCCFLYSSRFFSDLDSVGLASTFFPFLASFRATDVWRQSRFRPLRRYSALSSPPSDHSGVSPPLEAAHSLSAAKQALQ